MTTRAAEPSPWKASLRARLAQIGIAGALMLAVSALGLFLRVEHARTFDGPTRGSDYAVYVSGVRWMLEHHRPFNFDPSVPYQVRYQPPLWYALGALVLRLGYTERAISALSVGGWVIRQLLLARLLREAIPSRPWSQLGALTLSALLPLSVLIDGKVNPEGTHATLFMIAVYALWRIERQADSARGISPWTAAIFGLFAGLAVLTKGTAIVLMMAAAIVLAWRVFRSISTDGMRALLALPRRLLGPAFVAGLVWCLVVGWWCWPNYKKYGHPFPHDWDVDQLNAPATTGVMAQPALYRRPLGWALPLDFEYLKFPIICSPTEPRPNFWSAVIAGTWADYYNRGFCRLQGGGTTDRVWGADGGFMHRGRGGSVWTMSNRCVRLFVALVQTGLAVTIASVLAVAHTARSHLRSGGSRGSLVLPSVIALGVFFLFLFALVYPFDGSAVLNPRYLLPVTTPMAACVGFGLAEIEADRRPIARVALALSFVVLGILGVLLLFERFGR